MGRLDELDLGLSLSREEEAERLDAGAKRLSRKTCVIVHGKENNLGREAPAAQFAQRV